MLDVSVVNGDCQWCKWKLQQGCWILLTFTGKEAFTSRAQSGKDPFWNDPHAFVQVLQPLGQSDLTLLGSDSTNCTMQFSVMHHWTGALTHLLLCWHLQNCTLSLTISKSRVSWRVSTCIETVNSVVVLLFLPVNALGSFALQSWFRFFVLFLELFKTPINGIMHD